MRTDSFLRSALVGIGVAVVAVVVVYLIADAASGPLEATTFGSDDPMEIPVVGAVVATILGGAVGSGLAFVLRRLARAVPVFVGICVVALLLQGVQAFSAADTTSTAVWLNVLHIVAAVPIVGSLVAWLQTKTGAAMAAG